MATAEGSISQSVIASRILLGSGVPSDRLTLENRSTSTCQSASRLKLLLQPQPDEVWLVVTSAYHMPRTMGCFDAAGWRVVPYPTDFKQASPPGLWNPMDGTISQNLRLLFLASHEWAGLVYYRLRGYTNEWFPGPGNGSAVD